MEDHGIDCDFVGAPSRREWLCVVAIRAGTALPRRDQTLRVASAGEMPEARHAGPYTASTPITHSVNAPIAR